MNKPAVLFLCTGNACRSQIAEGFLRALGGETYDAHSAGTEPADAVHPLAVRVMAEAGVDIAAQRPKGVATYLGRLSARHLIVVCEAAERSCPRVFPGALNREFWPFDDPAAFAGTADDTLAHFRAVRDRIGGRVRLWLRERAASGDVDRAAARPAVPAGRKAT